MKERTGNFDIGEIKREFSILGPTEVVCKPKGFDRWCTLPYPNHIAGCPNFGKRQDCPPEAPYFLDIYRSRAFVAFLCFDFEKYLEIKKQIHPDWTDKALRNPRHWQDHLRMVLKKSVADTLKMSELSDYEAVYNPEAMSVNVHATCQAVGLELEWPPQKKMHRLAFLAKPLL
jgi:hypothetical protein